MKAYMRIGWVVWIAASVGLIPIGNARAQQRATGSPLNDTKRSLSRPGQLSIPSQDLAASQEYRRRNEAALERALRAEGFTKPVKQYVGSGQRSSSPNHKYWGGLDVPYSKLGLNAADPADVARANRVAKRWGRELGQKSFVQNELPNNVDGARPFPADRQLNYKYRNGSATAVPALEPKRASGPHIHGQYYPADKKQKEQRLWTQELSTAKAETSSAKSSTQSDKGSQDKQARIDALQKQWGEILDKRSDQWGRLLDQRTKAFDQALKSRNGLTGDAYDRASAAMNQQYDGTTAQMDSLWNDLTGQMDNLEKEIVRLRGY